MNALVTGCTSQDGSYLSELLLSKGYKVFGFVRSSSGKNLSRIEHILGQMTLLKGDMTDYASIEDAVKKSQADEIYNLAAHSKFDDSVNIPIMTCDVTGMGVLRLLEAVRTVKPDAKVFQASSSEMFGDTKETPQTELSKFHPRSPYGAAKAFAHHLSQFYRKHHKMFVSTGILYNHESPRRSNEFVTRKITEGIAKVKAGLQEKVQLGNLNTLRDWTHAKDVVNAMYLILQHKEPDDFVIGSGQTHSVKQWLEKTCEYANVQFWDVFSQAPEFERQSEHDLLCADPSKASRVLGWQPTVSFEEIVKEMYENDERKYQALPSHNS